MGVVGGKQEKETVKPRGDQLVIADRQRAALEWYKYHGLSRKALRDPWQAPFLPGSCLTSLTLVMKTQQTINDHAATVTIEARASGFRGLGLPALQAYLGPL